MIYMHALDVRKSSYYVHRQAMYMYVQGVCEFVHYDVEN